MLRVSRCGGQAPLLLVDDLAAELDEHARARVIDFLAERSVQVFVSTLDPGLLSGLPPSAAMFHVEHGCLQRQTKAATFSI
jgi:recombinational DNA repair ATPase RecF